MSVAHAGHAGDELARSRLEDFQRLAHLVEAQEAAIDVDDLDRFQELAAEFQAIRQRLGGSGPIQPVEAETDPEAHAALQKASSAAERLVSRLESSKRTQAGAINRVRHGTRRASRYNGVDGAPRSSGFTVKL